MHIKGRVVTASGAPANGAPVEVRGTTQARVTITVDVPGGRRKPQISTVTKSSDPVRVTADSSGNFTATVPTPEVTTPIGHVLGPQTYGAVARAIGAVGETLASVSTAHVQATDIDVGTIHLPVQGPAFQHVTLVRTLELGPSETRRVAEVVAVGAGPLTVHATTLKQVNEPPNDTHSKPIKIDVPDQPAKLSAFPLEGTGGTLHATGTGKIDVQATDGGPRHVWVVQVENPESKRRTIEYQISYTSTHPITKRAVKLSDLNKSVSRLLQLGPNDVDEPPIQFVIGQKLQVVVRPDWQHFFGQLSSFQVPGFVTVKTNATARPVIDFRAFGDKPALVMNLACSVGTIEGDVLDGWVATVKLTELSASLTFTFDVERQMIAPVCSGKTDITADIESSLALDIVTLGLSQAGADQAAKAATDALRTAVKVDIPAALNAKRFEFGKVLSAIFAGPDRPVLDIKADNGSVVVTYVDDEHDPLPTLDPQAADPTLANKVDNIVVLMLENRSFDHMLGYLQRDKGRDDIDGLKKPDARGNTGQWNIFGNEEYQPFRLSETQVPVDADPCHSTACVAEQIGVDSGMHGFVRSFAAVIASHPGCLAKPSDVMGYHGADHVWAYDAIAENFAVCDRWFASHPGPTWPNRFFTMSCHLGTGAEGGPDLDNTSGDTPIKLDTIFDELTRRNVSWRYFEHDIGFIRKVEQYTLDFEHVLPIDQPETGFFDLAAHGALPSVTFIDPNFVDFPDGHPANDDHPPADIALGQELVARVYNALRASPQWERTLFVVTYDEHGGMYDHHPPPLAPAPPGSLPTLGVRVPALVISPWIPAGKVSHTVFDHTALAKTIFRRFSPEAMPDLSIRFQNSPDLGELLSLEQPRSDALPSIAHPAGKRHAAKPAVPAVVDDALRVSLQKLRAHVDAHRPAKARPAASPPKLPHAPAPGK